MSTAEEQPTAIIDAVQPAIQSETKILILILMSNEDRKPDR